MRQDRGLILVTGATGRQGGAVVGHLFDQGWPVRALTRNPKGAAAEALAHRGIEVVQGDMGDPASLRRAMAGVYGVFSVQDWWTAGSEGEVAQGRNVAEAAKETRVQHVVYSSVGGAERQSGIPHFETKGVIEKYIERLDLPATLLRPVSFMENYYIPQVEKGIIKGRLVDPIRADKPIHLISTDDIGTIAAAVFNRGPAMGGHAFEIAGDRLTNPEIAETFGRVMGRKVRFTRMPLLAIRLFGGQEMYLMFKWFNEHGYQADIPALEAAFPEVQLTRLEAWIRREGWADKQKYERHAKTWEARRPRAAIS